MGNPIRRDEKKAWILIPVRLSSMEQEKQVHKPEAWFREGKEANEIGSGGSRQLEAERLRAEILSFCIKPRSRKEIAQQFGFLTQDYIIQKYVLPLVRSRMLQMTIPDHPRSKNQRYFSIRMPQDENGQKGSADLSWTD